MGEDDEPKTKEKHLETIACPWCEKPIEIIEEETIITPYRKKESTKNIVARKSAQTTF